MLLHKNENNQKFNKPLYGYKGQYTLSEGVELPYFSCIMSIERAIDELKIAEQVPASLDAKWSLEELFQREIDETRIKQDIIKGYLLDSNKLNFFNAITIVLMPKGEDEKIQDRFENVTKDTPPPIPWDGSDQEDAQWNNDIANQADFGGVQFVSIGQQARLRWDENRVLAATVDGQHRLWALRTFKEDDDFRRGTLSITEKKTQIPVIFILLHHDVGFINQQDRTDNSIRKISRELFTDLNKNAKTVDRARELILDDKSINARCVRTLVTNTTPQDDSNSLPLSLVRWQDNNNRFDESYYINSLVHLDLIVKDLLFLKEPSDPMDVRKVKKFIDDINNALGINGEEVKYDGITLTQFYERNCCDDDGEPEIPFSRLPEYYLASAVEGFEKNFKPWLIKLLTELKPYRELLNYARKNNLIEGTFGQYQAQTKKHKGIIKIKETAKDHTWYQREIDKPQKQIEKIKKDQWAFKAIFQKGVVNLGKIVEFDSKGQDKNLGTIEDILSFLDELYDRNILSLKANINNSSYTLWTFIALNLSSQKIKVTTTVKDRIFSILLLWYFGNRKILIDRQQGNLQFSRRKLLNHFKGTKNEAQWPGCKKAYECLYDAFNVNAFFGRDHEEISDKTKDEMVKEHFAKVLAAGIPDLANKVDESSVDDEELD
jgi:hypothetical protein